MLAHPKWRGKSSEPSKRDHLLKAVHPAVTSKRVIGLECRQELTGTPRFAFDPGAYFSILTSLVRA